jgi:Domain of unknown function (DUF1844)
MTSSEKTNRIIVDEDWKTQVERERSQVSNPELESPQQAGEKAPPETKLPPASFSLLLSALVTQTLAAMGQFPDPVSQKPEIHLEYARHNIDLLAILRDKTKGNLTTEESQMLEDSIHQLRLLYVQVQAQIE